MITNQECPGLNASHRDHRLKCEECLSAEVDRQAEEIEILTRSRDGWKADAEREARNTANKAQEIARLHEELTINAAMLAQQCDLARRYRAALKQVEHWDLYRSRQAR